MKVAVYCRVSTEDQADARTIENQVDFARGYCRLHGLDIYDLYLDDGVSGTIPLESRPAGSILLGDARKGLFGAVYVYRLDRLARTTLDILKTHQGLSESGVALKSMTENFDTSTPSGKFFMTTLGGIAEIERDTIAERMRVGKDRAIREGRWPGGPPPYGYSLAGKRLVINEGETAVVRVIFNLYTVGGMGTATIADYLNAMGVPSPAGSGKRSVVTKGWHASRIWSIVSNPVYRGAFLYGRRGGRAPVEIKCPPVVSAGEWEAAGEARRLNSLYAGRNSKREYLLKGLVRCAVCGGKYYGDGSGREGRLCYYRCSGSTARGGAAAKCPARSVRADIIEKIVWEDVCSFVSGAGAVLEKINNKFPVSREGISRAEQIAGLDKAINSREPQRKRIIGLYRQGVISGEDVSEQLALIDREAEVLKRRRSEVAGAGWPVTPAGPHCPGERLRSAGFRAKRNLVRELVDDITVGLAHRAGRAVPLVTVRYIFDGFTDCSLIVETRGKYRLGVPKAYY